MKLQLQMIKNQSEMGGGALSVYGGQNAIHQPAQNSVSSFVQLDTDFASPKSQIVQQKKEDSEEMNPANLKPSRHSKNNSGQIKLPITEDTPFVISTRKDTDPMADFPEPKRQETIGNTNSQLGRNMLN